jgi:hypothetical protein
MTDEKNTAKSNLFTDQDHRSLVERIFDDPDVVCEGEYITLYDFLLAPDICNDPEHIAAVLREFAGWATYMLERMQGLNLIE